MRARRHERVTGDVRSGDPRPRPASRRPDPGGSATGPARFPLRVERADDGVVVLTFDLPGERNAMTDALTAAWAETVASLEGDRSVHCVVVTGEGKAFCAGGDVGWLASEPDATVDQLRDRMLPSYRTWLSLRALDVPLDRGGERRGRRCGRCPGPVGRHPLRGGVGEFTVPFAQLGMHAGMATAWLLPEVVGLAAARELLRTGRVVDGR